MVARSLRQCHLPHCRRCATGQSLWSRRPPSHWLLCALFPLRWKRSASVDWWLWIWCYLWLFGKEGTKVTPDRDSSAQRMQAATPFVWFQALSHHCVRGTEWRFPTRPTHRSLCMMLLLEKAVISTVCLAASLVRPTFFSKPLPTVSDLHDALYQRFPFAANRTILANPQCRTVRAARSSY